ncbi:MAG: DUF2207 domain-containing protein [Oscillospiraceae bacterium]|nr:DUF2207 domain-containing protein [Oscillospiraceae bacterium]
MKKILIALLCCCLLATAAMGVSLDRLTTDCTVDEDGDCHIVQTAEFKDVDSAQPLTLAVSEGAQNVSVDGCSAAVRGQLVTVEGGLSGDVTLVMRYDLARRAEETETGQRLTAELVCAQWELPAERYKFTVVLPEKTDAQPRFTGGYDGAGVEDKLTVSAEGRAVSGILRGGLLDHDSFTMTLDVPAGYFRAGTHRSTGAAPWILTALIVLLAAAAVWYWLRFLRSGRLHVQSRTLPPDGVTAAELPLLLCGCDAPLGALVCEWAELGYLTVTEKRAGAAVLRKSMDMGAERREEERRIFDALFRSSDVCESDSPRWKKATDAAAKLLRGCCARRLYDRAGGGPLIPRALAVLACGLALLNTMAQLLPAGGVKWLLLIVSFAAGAVMGAVIVRAVIRAAVRDIPWLICGAASFAVMFLLARVGGGLLPMVIALALACAAGGFTRFGGRLTAAGVGVMEQCLGFVRFLEEADAEHLASLLERDEQTVRRLLLYAHTAGLGRRFAAQLPDAEQEPYPWLQTADGAQAQLGAMYDQLKRVLTALK